MMTVEEMYAGGDERLKEFFIFRKSENLRHYIGREKLFPLPLSHLHSESTLTITRPEAP